MLAIRKAGEMKEKNTGLKTRHYSRIDSWTGRDGRQARAPTRERGKKVWHPPLGLMGTVEFHEIAADVKTVIARGWSRQDLERDGPLDVGVAL